MRGLGAPDSGGGFEGGPGEPEVVGVDYGGQGLAGQGAVDGAAEDVPGRAGLFVDECVGVGAECEGLVAEPAVVDAGCAHVSGGGNVAAVQRRGRAQREEYHYRRPTNVVVDHGGLLQFEEGVGHRLTTKVHSSYTLHGAEASVLRADEEEGRGVDVVVAGVGVAAVLAGEARVPGEDLAVRIVLSKVGPGDDGGGNLGSRAPVSLPTIASPRICCHQLSVSRSYMMRSL